MKSRPVQNTVTRVCVAERAARKQIFAPTVRPAFNECGFERTARWKNSETEAKRTGRGYQTTRQGPPGAGVRLPRAHRDEYRLEEEWVAPLLEDLLAAVAPAPATHQNGSHGKIMSATYYQLKGDISSNKTWKLFLAALVHVGTCAVFWPCWP